jgi:hypothetical protein
MYCTSTELTVMLKPATENAMGLVPEEYCHLQYDTL